MTLTRTSNAVVTLVLACLLSACATSPYNRPPPIIGTVTALAGSPQIIRGQQSYMIDVRSRLFEGDIVRTNEFSRVRIEMVDGSHIGIGTHSRIVFNRYHFEQGQDQPTARLTLTEGFLRAQAEFETDARRGQFEVKTPLAVIGVRAADVFVALLRSANTVDVAMLEGTGIYVSNANGGIEIDHKGVGTTVIGGNAPLLPQQWSERKLAQAIAETII